MTMKLEEITTFVPFGYGRIGKTISSKPETLDEPIIMFIHKRAVAGKYHDGEPVLTPREEKAMLKDVEALVALLTKFNHTDDFVKVEDTYNQPRGSRKRRVNPVVDEKAKVEVVETPAKSKGGRRKKAVEEPVAETPVEQPAEAPRAKRKYTRRQKVEEAPKSELIPAATVKREREMAAAHEAPAETEKPKRGKRVTEPNAKAAIIDPIPDKRRVVRRKVEGKSRATGAPKEVAVEVKRSRKRAEPTNVVPLATKGRTRKTVEEPA